MPCLRRHQLRVLATTYNVGEVKPDLTSIRTWLGAAGASSADVVVVALQEVVMSASTMAMDAAFSVISRAQLEKGNQLAQGWALDIGTALGSDAYVRIALRQLAGMLLLVFCKRDLAQSVGEVSTASVACGVMGVGGNKGAVAVCMSIFRRRAVFVCSHFAAHQERVEDRNADYAKIVKSLRFDDSGIVGAAAAGAGTGGGAGPSMHNAPSSSLLVQPTSGSMPGSATPPMLADLRLTEAMGSDRLDEVVGEVSSRVCVMCAMAVWVPLF